MQLSPWVLQVPVTCRNGGCGSQNKNDAGNSHALEGQKITDHKVQSLEHKAPSLPLPHLKDEDVYRTRG